MRTADDEDDSRVETSSGVGSAAAPSAAASSSAHVAIYADGGRGAGSGSRLSRANALERQLQSDEAVRVPKVTVHGTAKARRDRAASAYVINGPETNVATGSGIRLLFSTHPLHQTFAGDGRQIASRISAAGKGAGLAV